MGRTFLLPIGVIFLILCAFRGQDPKYTYRLPAGLSAKDYQANTLIVKFKQVSFQQKTFGSNNQKIANTSQTSFISVKPVYQFASATKRTLSEQRKIDEVGLNRIYEVKYKSSLPIENVIEELLQRPDVAYAEPSFVYHSFSYNDPDFIAGKQSYLEQVKAPEAWTLQSNANGAVIAIIDSGSDLQHQDLADNIYVNSKDPINGIDDDQDGYVDNYWGWDFVGTTASKIVEDNNPDIPADSLDHGVHVSGLASAVSNNQTGICSIAGNAKLMLIKAGADNNSSAIYKGYEGIIYAADHGAKIINCSWGGPGGGAYGQDVINYAVSKGCLVVVAAGNSKTNEPIFPAAYAGAFAVANVNSNDEKSTTSSYGYHVAIAAPGTGIYSTLNNNAFGYKSGTSMAAPLVSSAAALLLAKNPSLSGLQIGEILRLSADDIYSNGLNALYQNQLGSGRLNVYNALKMSNSPSIRYQKIEINDSSNGALAAGDTVSYYFELKNLLASTSNMEVKLSSDNPNVKVLNASVNAGAFIALESKKIGPIKVLVSRTAPENTPILFKLAYENPLINYSAHEFFSSTVNLDYQNITVNQLYTTITSNGRIGYSKANAHDGLGVLYKDFSLLYEASLMVGLSPTQVSNNARSGNGESDNDFVKVKGVSRVQSKVASYEGISFFNDSNAKTPIGISVSQKQLAFGAAPNDKYVIVEYELTNNTASQLNRLFIGLFTDWDIDESSKNFLNYDEQNRLAYVNASTPLTPFAGVKLLSTKAQPLFYPLSYQLGADLLYDGIFTTKEKYETLSSGIKGTTLGSGDGVDVMCVIGNGPFNIAAGKSVKIAFAIIVGDDLPDIQKSAELAEEKYKEMQVLAPSDVFKLSQNYPNPASKTTALNLALPEDGIIAINIYDYLGRQLKQVVNQSLKKGNYTYNIDLTGMRPGIYFCRALFNGQQQVVKMLVAE